MRALRGLFGVNELAVACLMGLGYTAMHGELYAAALFLLYAALFVSQAGSRDVDPRLLPVKARLDLLDYYPRPVRLEGVRVRVSPMLFRILQLVYPLAGRFRGIGTRTSIWLRSADLLDDEDLLVHELCHVWQGQHRWLHGWWTYLTVPYEENPYEAEARRAVAETRISREVASLVEQDE